VLTLDPRVVARGELPVGRQIYLLDNPPLRERLRAEHVKLSLTGSVDPGR
jgi:hypothetical protein